MNAMKHYLAASGVVPGRLDAAAYEALAMRHRPSDTHQIAAEVMRLHCEQQLTPQDISAALRIDHSIVVQILSTTGAPQ